MLRYLGNIPRGSLHSGSNPVKPLSRCHRIRRLRRRKNKPATQTKERENAYNMQNPHQKQSVILDCEASVVIAPETGIQLTLTGSSFLVVDVGDSLSDEFAARQNGIHQ